MDGIRRFHLQVEVKHRLTIFRLKVEATRDQQSVGSDAL